MSVKAAGTGHFQIPTAPAALTAVAQSASANTLGAAVSFGNAPSALYITGVTIGVATTQVPTYIEIQILVAAAIVASVLVPYGVSSGVAASVLTGYRAINPPIPVANAAAITVKSASSVASAVAWGVSLECIAQANVVDDGIAMTANVTQWNSSAVSAPATAGVPDVNTKNINNVAAATPGAANGILISGTNAGTTTLGALTVTGATTHTGATVHTGNVSFADGITVAAPSTGNRAGLSITGNGTGAGAIITGGATGVGLNVIGGATSGDGVKVTTTSGHGINLAPVGASVHGLFATGGNSGTSDGIKAAAGTGGVDFRASQTGSLTGSVSGSVGSVTGAVGSVTGNVGGNVVGSTASVVGAVGSVTGNVGGNVTGSVASVVGNVGGNVTGSVGSVVGAVGSVTGAVGSVTGAVGSVTGNVGGNVTGSVGSVVGAVGSVTGLTASDVGAIKLQTDKLVFTTVNKLDVGLYYVNGQAIIGTGTIVDPWRSA